MAGLSVAFAYAALAAQPEAFEFVAEAYKHCKAIAASGAGVGLLAHALPGKFSETEPSGKQAAVSEGVVSSREASISNVAAAFTKAIAQHRHWERENIRQ